jgi:hypothetical protein
MEKGSSNNLSQIKYANLSEKEGQNLREYEKKFNEEFGSSYYFLVFDKNSF